MRYLAILADASYILLAGFLLCLDLLIRTVQETFGGGVSR